MRLISARKLFLVVIGLYLIASSYVLQRSRSVNRESKADGGGHDKGLDDLWLMQKSGDTSGGTSGPSVLGSSLDEKEDVDGISDEHRDDVQEDEGKEKAGLAEAPKVVFQEFRNASWEKLQDKRKATLKRVCKNQPELNVNMTWIIHEHKRWLWPFIYNDDHKLIYCYVSKIASTNWKSAFLVLQGKYKRVEDVRGSRAHDPSLHKLSKLTPPEIEFRLKNYTKFLFVRDPMSRALSAYRSKFLQKNKSFQRGFGRRIIKMYRPNPDQHALATGEGVTFPEFATYLSNAAPAKMDGHWKPIHDMVLPCGIDFDYIGKLETGHDDSVNILKTAHVDHLIYFKESKRNVSHDQGVFDSFFDQLGPEHIKGLYKTYELDFKLFGYELPEKMKKWVFGK